MAVDLGFLDDNGISTDDGMSYTGGKDKYISALQRYFRGYEANRKAVEGFLSSGDIENYGIKVHSLKSNSRMIGARELSDAFEELELAAAENNTALIQEKTGEVLSMYEKVTDIIRPLGEMETVRVSGEIGAEEARETADRLLEALDDFDDELSKELAVKLMGYPFRITQKGMLNEALEHITDFMYDEAAGLIREIIPAIE